MQPNASELRIARIRRFHHRRPSPSDDFCGADSGLIRPFFFRNPMRAFSSSLLIAACCAASCLHAATAVGQTTPASSGFETAPPPPKAAPAITPAAAPAAADGFETVTPALSTAPAKDSVGSGAVARPASPRPREGGAPVYSTTPKLNMGSVTAPYNKKAVKAQHRRSEKVAIKQMHRSDRLRDIRVAEQGETMQKMSKARKVF